MGGSAPKIRPKIISDFQLQLHAETIEALPIIVLDQRRRHVSKLGWSSLFSILLLSPPLPAAS